MPVVAQGFVRLIVVSRKMIRSDLMQSLGLTECRVDTIQNMFSALQDLEALGEME
jgi:hypothetical protein